MLIIIFYLNLLNLYYWYINYKFKIKLLGIEIRKKNDLYFKEKEKFRKKIVWV